MGLDDPRSCVHRSVASVRRESPQARTAKPGDPVSWRVLDSVDGWQTLPARLIREGLRTVGSVLHAINGAKDEWRTQQAERMRTVKAVPARGYSGIRVQSRV